MKGVFIMTRQKKEIMKKIDEMHTFILADIELGCGHAPAGFYDPIYQQISDLEEELAHLSHYASAMEMMMDSRGCENEGIPF